jgi:hypothetical protein
MSDGKRFMGHNRVTHRQIGEIPGILVAKDVFVRVPLEVMRAATSVRCDQFCGMIQSWLDGQMSFVEFKNHPFHLGDTVLSVIKNPAKPYQPFV